MVCYIKYRWVLNPIPNEYDDITIMDDNLSCKSRTTMKSAKSLIVSKSKNLEENRMLMVNSDCPIQILINYIATELDFDKTREFDFCNSDGNLIGIMDLQQWENAKDIMLPNKTYVIVFIERNSFREYTDFEIFLKQDTDIYNDVTKKLRKYLPSSNQRLQGKTNKSAPSRIINFKSQTSERASSATDNK